MTDNKLFTVVVERNNKLIDFDINLVGNRGRMTMDFVERNTFVNTRIVTKRCLLKNK